MADVKIVDPGDGSLTTIDESDLPEALRLGFRVLEKEKEQPGGINIPGAAGAAITGAGQGALVGFSDEAMAAMQTLSPVEAALTAVAPGLGVITRTARGALGLESQEEKATREKILQAERAKIAAARAEHPIAYGAGELGGAIAPAFIPYVGPATRALGGVRAVAGAAPTVARILPAIGRGAATGAAIGGAAGVGYSDAETPVDALVSGARGAAIGGALGGALPALGAVGKMVFSNPIIQTAAGVIRRAVSSLGAKGAAALTGVKETTVQRLFRDPHAVDAARELPDIAEDILEKIKTLKRSASAKKEEALLALERSGETMPVNEILETLNSSIAKAEKTGLWAGAKERIAALKELAKDIEEQAEGGRISLVKLKGLVDELDEVIDYGQFPSADRPSKYSASGKKMAIALYSIRDRIDDYLVRVPEYELIMGGLRQDAKMLQTAYRLSSDPKRLINIMKRVDKGAKDWDVRSLTSLDDYMGKGTLEEVKDAAAKADTLGTHTTGSAGTVLGATSIGAVGQAFGIPYPVGAAIGAGIGRLRDVAGGRALAATMRGMKGITLPETSRIPIGTAVKVRAIQELSKTTPPEKEEPEPKSTIQQIRPGAVFYRIVKEGIEQTIDSNEWPYFADRGWRIRSEYKPASR